MAAQQPNQEEEGNPYMNNIWGWKTSFWGLGVLLFMIALITYGHVNGLIDYKDQELFPAIEHPLHHSTDSLKSQ